MRMLLLTTLRSDQEVHTYYTRPGAYAPARKPLIAVEKMSRSRLSQTNIKLALLSPSI